MTQIRYNDFSFSVGPGESVLDCILRNGIDISHACKAGACNSCMMKANQGTIPSKAQVGLRDSLKEQGYFLPCVCFPDTDLVLTDATELKVPARVVERDMLSQTVLRVRLRMETEIPFRAGQYFTLFRQDGLARSYSAANLPGDNWLELHVRLIPGGKMSGWLANQAGENEPVWVQGPFGFCFYTNGNPEQPLLLAGTGTGLAPLYGILRDALENGHQGPIMIFHGALDGRGLYLVPELQELSQQYPQVTYVPTVLHPDNADPAWEVGLLDEVVKRKFNAWRDARIFLCGDPVLVNGMKKKFFLAGAALKNIYADAFTFS
ncbi:MAG: 2Fe-2S iron-sulfur cluster binding domain-containing protein [Blastocatellia bacterium]|nr:2Fe-2S iron-sulfur cluster binding domain-containing protein [Blastocatellia bacterium]